VLGGSHAEKLGIRVGDVIKCFNGEQIHTAIEVDIRFIKKFVKIVSLTPCSNALSLDFDNFLLLLSVGEHGVEHMQGPS
jgi:hypothetical protein